MTDRVLTCLMLGMLCSFSGHLSADNNSDIIAMQNKMDAAIQQCKNSANAILEQKKKELNWTPGASKTFQQERQKTQNFYNDKKDALQKKVEELRGLSDPTAQQQKLKELEGAISQFSSDCDARLNEVKNGKYHSHIRSKLSQS